MAKWFAVGALIAAVVAALAYRPWRATITDMAAGEYPPGYQ